MSTEEVREALRAAGYQVYSRDELAAPPPSTTTTILNTPYPNLFVLFDGRLCPSQQFAVGDQLFYPRHDKSSTAQVKPTGLGDETADHPPSAPFLFESAITIVRDQDGLKKRIEDKQNQLREAIERNKEAMKTATETGEVSEVGALYLESVRLQQELDRVTAPTYTETPDVKTSSVRLELRMGKNVVDGHIIELVQAETVHTTSVQQHSQTIMPHEKDYSSIVATPCSGSFVRKLEGAGGIRGVALADGLVYLADMQNCCVQVFNSRDGSFVRTWGSYGAGQGQFKLLEGIAVSDGLVYTTDRSNNRVQVFNSRDGAFVRMWGCKGSDNGQFDEPWGISVDGGLVYVTDERNSRVQVFNSSDGSFVRTWGSNGKGDGQFNSVSGIAVDKGIAYVVDAFSHRIQVFNSRDGSFLRTLGSEGIGPGLFSCPYTIAVDREFLYVTDGGNHSVQVFSRRSEAFVCRWGSKGSHNGQFDHPLGIAVANGMAYISDNNGVRAFS